MANNQPTNNTTAEPTQWNFNPIVNTASITVYDNSALAYDTSTQPYDGYPSGNRPYNWKNATGWTNSLVYPAEQQYYGGPSYVPLYGAPTVWDFNAGMVNQAGQYVSSLSGSADIYPYDQAVAYDKSGVTFDGVNISAGTDIYDNASDTYDGEPNDIYGESYDDVYALPFYNWKSATYWTPIAGSRDF